MTRYLAGWSVAFVSATVFNLFVGEWSGQRFAAFFVTFIGGVVWAAVDDHWRRRP